MDIKIFFFLAFIILFSFFNLKKKDIYMNVGETVFSFELKDHLANTVTEKNFTGKWTVLYFYPKDSTPGCTTEACDFRDNLSDYEALETQVYGVSKDSEKSHINFATKQNLNFPLIVDTDLTLIKGFDIWKLKKNYGKEYMGTVRSTFIIDPEGKIAKRYNNVRVKGHVEKILSDLKELQS
jgi:peroxiredoxin Q/BCP